MADYIRKEQDRWGRWTYYYKCENCGKEFYRSRHGKDIIGLCGTCSRKRDTIKQRYKLKKRDLDIYTKGYSEGFKAGLIQGGDRNCIR